MDAASATQIALIVGIVSAASALFGVLITNGFNVFIQWRQRQHDAAQKGMDRLATLRREVYLDAVEACTVSIGELVHLVRERDEAERQKNLARIPLAVAKVQLVSTPETALLAQKLGTAYALASQSLTLLGGPARRLEADVKVRTGLIDDIQVEMNNLIETMRQANLAQRNDPAYWDVLTAMQAGCMQRRAAMVDEQTTLQNEHIVEVGKFQAKLIELIAPLNGHMRAALDSLRGELGLPAATLSQVMVRNELEQVMKSSLADLSATMESQGLAAFDAPVPAHSVANGAKPLMTASDDQERKPLMSIIPNFLKRSTDE